MKLKALIGIAAALSLTACGGGTGTSEATSYKICMATIVSHPALDAAAKGFKSAMEASGSKVTFDEQNAQGDQSTLTNIANTFASSDCDGYYAIATPTAQALANVIADKPIVFAAVTDPVQAGLVSDWDKPDSNITGTSDLNPMKAQLELIREITPNVKRVGIVYSSGEVNSEVQVKEAEENAKKLGMEIVKATVTNSSEVQQAAESLDVDAYLIPTDNTVVSAAESVIQVAETKKRPVYGSDESTIKRGAAAGLSVNYEQQGKDAAALMLKMLKGTPAAELPIKVQEEFDLFVNSSGAQQQGVTLPEAVTKRATKQF